MNKTKIEWVRNPDGSQGYTHNSMSGCRNHTPEGLCLDGLFPCYAYKLANGRLKQRYLANGLVAYDYYGEGGPGTEEGLKSAWADPFYPRFWPERLYHPWDGQPKGIFLCDMGDLFGIGIPEEWTRASLRLCRLHEQNRYYLLTKQPQRLPEFSPFPENCWVGVTATNAKAMWYAMKHLKGIEARIKFLSLEPLLEAMPNDGGWPLLDSMANCGITWLILGACTGTETEMRELCKRYPELTPMRWRKRWTAQPPIKWLSEIVDAADKVGIPLFLKNNLMPLFEAERIKPEDGRGLRQEMPG